MLEHPEVGFQQIWESLGFGYVCPFVLNLEVKLKKLQSMTVQLCMLPIDNAFTLIYIFKIMYCWRTLQTTKNHGFRPQLQGATLPRVLPDEVEENARRLSFQEWTEINAKIEAHCHSGSSLMPLRSPCVLCALCSKRVFVWGSCWQPWPRLRLFKISTWPRQGGLPLRSFEQISTWIPFWLKELSFANHHVCGMFSI